MRSTLSLLAVLGCAVTPGLQSTRAEAQHTLDGQDSLHHVHHGVDLMRLRRAHPHLHHIHPHVERRYEWRTPQWDLLNQGVAVALSSLNGGEFTTLPITASASDRQNSKALNGGEFTTLPVTESAPSATHKKNRPTSTSVPYAGGANSQRESTFPSTSTSVPYAGGANSQRESTFPSTRTTHKSSAKSTQSSKSPHRGNAGGASSNSDGSAKKTSTPSTTTTSTPSTTSTSTPSTTSTSTSSPSSTSTSSPSETSTSNEDGSGITSTSDDDSRGATSTSSDETSTPSATDSTPTSTDGTSDGATSSSPTPSSSTTSDDSQTSVDPSQNLSDGKDKDSTDHTGLIAGLSTAGGVVIVALLLFLLYKLYKRRQASERQDNIVWPDVSHEVNYDPAPVTVSSDRGFAPSSDAQDPFQDPILPPSNEPYHDTMAHPSDPTADIYSTVPDALVPAPASHHHAYPVLHPEAPPPTSPQGEQHYVVGQTYPQAVDMYQPTTRELYHGEPPLSLRP